MRRREGDRYVPENQYHVDEYHAPFADLSEHDFCRLAASLGSAYLLVEPQQGDTSQRQSSPEAGRDVSRVGTSVALVDDIRDDPS